LVGHVPPHLIPIIAFSSPNELSQVDSASDPLQYRSNVLVQNIFLQLQKRLVTMAVSVARLTVFFTLLVGTHTSPIADEPIPTVYRMARELESEEGSGDTTDATTTDATTTTTTTRPPIPIIWKCDSDIRPCYSHMLCEDKPNVDCDDGDKYPPGKPCHDFVCISDPDANPPRNSTDPHFNKPHKIMENIILFPALSEQEFMDQEREFKEAIGDVDLEGGIPAEVDIDRVMLRDNDKDVEVEFTVTVVYGMRESVEKQLASLPFLASLESHMSLETMPRFVLGETFTTTKALSTTTKADVDGVKGTTTKSPSSSGSSKTAVAVVVVLLVIVLAVAGAYFWKKQRGNRVAQYSVFGNEAYNPNDGGEGVQMEGI